MEIYEVVGFRRVHFTDTKQNKEIDGYTLFLQREPEDDQIVGLECAKQFIASEYVAYTPQVGDRIQLIYNRYGKISSIQTC